MSNIPLAAGFGRGGQFPVDSDSVFAAYTTAKAYVENTTLSSGVAYLGQIISVTGNTSTGLDGIYSVVAGITTLYTLSSKLGSGGSGTTYYAGTGVSISAGNTISIGQSVATTSGVTFSNINLTGGINSLKIKDSGSLASNVRAAMQFANGGNTTTWEIGTDSQSSGVADLYIYNNNGSISIPILINPSNNVAIGGGITNPSEKLEVNGNIKATSLKLGPASVKFYPDNNSNLTISIGNTLPSSGTVYNSIAIGNYSQNSLFNNGHDNIGLGYQSMSGISSGYQNIAIGSAAMLNAAASYNNIAIGTESGYSLNSSNGNVSIGTKSLRQNAAGDHNTAIGNEALYNIAGPTNRSRNTSIGAYSLWNTTAGSNNAAIGYSSGANLTTGSNNIFIGFNAQPSSNTVSNEATLGDANLTLFRPGAHNTINLGGVVGGVTYAWKNVYSVNSVIVTSDERTKTDIQPSSLGLNFINNLNPVSYKFKVGENRVEVDENGNEALVGVPGSRTHFGLIAQEVKRALPENQDFGGWVLGEKDNPNSLQMIRYEQFISPMIKAIQELTAEVNILKNRISELENK